MENTLYIIDGHALIYRAYYAFINRPLITTKGETSKTEYISNTMGRGWTIHLNCPVIKVHPVKNLPTFRKRATSLPLPYNLNNEIGANTPQYSFV